jgi:glycyl-tRNA synthetase beta chain
MSAELFLEIGTEEIPAGFLPTAMADLERLVRKELETGRIGFGSVQTYATPRRLVLAVKGVAAGQERQEVTASGPSVSVAFDAEGNPTKAAMGFARSNGVEVSDLERRQTDKGEYLFVSKVIEGQPTASLLPEMLPRIIDAIPFKKSMRWKDLDIRFARPMHWVVALFDGQIVPFSYGNLTSGNLSRGHRFMAPDTFEVSGLEQYLEEAEKRYVIVDPAKRRKLIAEQLAEAVGRTAGMLNPDDDLLDEVTFLVEYPTAVMGGFEETYLQLPPELLITVMREHQRYFTVVDGNGKLLPRFVTISNTCAEDLAVVQRGNERVLRARLSDAMFFWNEDRKVKLATRLDALKNVVYQAKLGTSYEKVMRFKTLAVELAGQLAPGDVDLTERAALLAKCDLETGMVFEFTELQGVMGREYALLDGEDPRVARAIFEHYLPVQAGGALPGDDVGAFVSIADKVDSICGCFGVGLIPTGTADPFALRRSAIGILNIILDRGYRLSLPALIGRSLELLTEKLTRPAAEVGSEVLEFFRLRFFNMLTSAGLPNDVVDAVLSASFDEPVDAQERVKALASFRGEGEFAALAVTFKRVVNIVKDGVDVAVDAQLFEAECEGQLSDALQRVSGRFEQFVADGAYLDALRTVGELRSPVDALFEGVMVMSPDEAVKTNRLALLTGVARLFQGIADFSKIAA